MELGPEPRSSWGLSPHTSLYHLCPLPLQQKGGIYPLFPDSIRRVRWTYWQSSRGEGETHADFYRGPCLLSWRVGAVTQARWGREPHVSMCPPLRGARFLPRLCHLPSFVREATVLTSRELFLLSLCLPDWLSVEINDKLPPWRDYNNILVKLPIWKL